MPVSVTINWPSWLSAFDSDSRRSTVALDCLVTAF